MLVTVLFMTAGSVLWLFVARGLQGLATGAALSAASAALLDLHPRRDPAGVGLTNGVVSAGGLGLGGLVSATIVQLLPAPRVLPYVALFVLFAIALAGVVAMPEPVASRARPRLTPQRPGVPAAIRRPFFLAALGVMSSWSIGGLFLSLGPQLSAALFHTTNHLVSGVPVFALAGSAALGQLVFGRTAPWASAVAGSVALAAGLVIIVFAATDDSSALLLTGGGLGGIGFGAALGVLEVDDEAVDHLLDVLDDRVQLARSEPDAAAVEGGVRAAGDDAAAALGEHDPVALAPDAGVEVEVRGAVALAVGVVPEAHRHRRHRLGDHHLAELADDRLALLVERLDVDAQAAARDLAVVDRLQEAARHECAADVGAAAAVDEADVGAELLVDVVVALGRQGRAREAERADARQVEVASGLQ